MSIIQRWRKRAIVGFMTVFVMLTLTGCDVIPEDIQSNISNAFSARAALNMDVATKLHNSGIISDDLFKKLEDNINRNLEDFGASIKSASADSGKNMLKACVGWKYVPEPVYDEDSGELLYYKEAKEGSDWNLQFITNLIIDKQPGLLANVPVLGQNGKQVKPIEVISESAAKELNKQLSIPIWVLKTDINDPNGLDGIIEAVKQAESNKSEAGLANYFQEASYIDDEGNKQAITLLNPDVEEEKLIRATRGADTATDKEDPFLITKQYKEGIGGKVKQIDDKEKAGTGQYNTSNSGFVSNGKVGYDMTVVTGGEESLSVRLVEFNSDAFDELVKRIGLSNKRYMVINNRAYLMEYPLGYIDGFKESEDRTKYTSVIKRSEIGFNLLTGEFSKFTVENGVITNQSVITNKEDPYLVYSGAKNASAESQSSLVLYGETGITGTVPKGKDGEDVDLECNPPWDIKLGGGKNDLHTVSIGRIVLRDYLEATYAPGVVGSDKLVVLGRKMRILQLEGDKKNVLARFYDKEGKMLGGDSAKLFIDDFAEVKAITMPEPTVEYISREKDTLTEDNSSAEASEETDTAETDTDEAETDAADSDEDPTEDIKNSISKIDKLPQNILSKVSCSTLFPGEYIGRGDYSSSDEKPLFYAMVVKASMFETGLFSGWVQSTDQEKNSTVWWNNWLEKHGFTYRVNTDNLVKYLKGNYAYDLSQSGIIILDLETISKIQQEYTEQHKEDTAHGLRTLFIIVGYILIAYATILLISWNVDVNVDLGFNILEKVSFGKWVAIKDFDEMPGVNLQETNFITFGPLVVSCICIIGLGMILIMINIIDVILLLIQLFGGIAEYITKIITGVK